MTHKKSSDLLQVLGVGFGVAILVGNSIGIGILRMPGTVASYVGSEGLIMLLWTLGGFITLAGAVIYGEAGAAYPFSGGPYAISEHVFGKQAGFTVGICDWVLNIAGNAALAIAAAEYYIACTGCLFSKALLASLTIIALTAIQWFGMRSSSIIQQALSVLKALGLLFLVLVFFIHSKATGAVNVTTTTAPISHVTIFSAFILSFRSIVYTYMGWNAPIYFAEENNNPGKSLPHSLIIGVLSITFIYLLVNASLLHLMPVSAISNSALAVADGAAIVFGSSAKLVVTLVSIIIVLSGLYPSILYTPRIIFGMARSGLFFPLASKLNRFYIPGLALIISSFIALLFAATGTFEFAVAVTSFLYIFVDITVYVASLYARRGNKTEFFYKAPNYPITHVFMILVNIALLISIFAEERISSSCAVLIIALTVPLYMVYKRVMPKQVSN